MKPKHLPHCDTRACISAQEKSVSSVHNQAVKACFTLVSAANHLPAERFLRVQRVVSPEVRLQL